MRLVWFRRDLRSFDNTALTAALNSGDPVAAMYIATPEQWHQHHLAPIQADLIWRRLAELQQELAALNVPLFYQQVADFQAAAVAVSQLAKTLNATQVLANRDYELDEQQRDQLAQQLLSEQGIIWSAFDDKCVLPPGSVRTKQGEFFKSVHPFQARMAHSISAACDWKKSSRSALERTECVGRIGLASRTSIRLPQNRQHAMGCGL